MAPVYTKLFLLGSGSYGSAWVVTAKDSTNKKVKKEVNLAGLSERNVDQALLEVEALARCKHENVICYYEAFVDKSTMVLSIVMDYASEGDLHKHISQRRGLYFPNDVILVWFSQLLSALAYIHKRGILHRDIKPQNLFLDERHVLKLGDFGICKILPNEADVAVTIIGTPFYLSPEICQQKPYSFKSDIWSAGCVLYELCCLHVPFTAPNLPSLTSQILKGVYNPLPSHCDDVLCEFVKVLLVPDPEKRPPAKELLQFFHAQQPSRQKEGQVLMDADMKQKVNKEQIKINERKRSAWLKVEDSPDHVKKGKSWRGPEQKGIDSTTYTIVRCPKLRRLSPASSPELSLLLERQRSSSSSRLQAPDVRRVQSVDAPRVNRQKQKKMRAPRLNLLKAAMDLKIDTPNGDVEEKNLKSEIEFDADTVRQVTKAVYCFRWTEATPQRAHAVEEIRSHLLNVLGQDQLDLVLAAVRAKTDHATLVNNFCLGPSVLQAVLWYLTLA